MKSRTYLLATASGIAAAAAAGTAQAADMGVPMKAAPPLPAAAPTWTGFYIGGNLGAAWQNSHTEGTGYQCCTTAHAISNSITQTGFTGGGQVGYNFQNGNAVYGLEADISGLTGTASVTQPYSSTCCGKASSTTSKIDWLATFRGRLGLAVNNSLVYATAGLAVGRVNDSFTTFDPNASAQWTDHSTRTGLAVGGGVEEMLSPNWTLRLEGLFVDLGRKTVALTSASGTFSRSSLVNSSTATFSNQAVIARVGLNYKF